MGKQLHIVLVPMLAHGHMIPMLDMAKLFISRGLKITIISTSEFSNSVKKACDSGLDIGLRIINFPPEGSKLPYHVTSLDRALEMRDVIPEFIKSLSLLQKPVEKVLQEIHPDAIVSDMFLPWTVDSAAKLGIPRLIFHGISCTALCAEEHMMLHKPYKNLLSDSDSFIVPGLPGNFTFVRSQVADYQLTEDENGFYKLFKQMAESNLRSYGTVVNSFYELEQDYADHFKNFLGQKAWPIGPLFLPNNSEGAKGKAQRGRKSSIDEDECLAWLDSKSSNSVVYMCFGSMANFSPTQLHETAIGIEKSSQRFIWVVRQSGENEDWLPEGFEERTKDKGLIIRGWAPQAMILDHKAIGAFVTHCGWNSTLEGVCAGLPMVTWPTFAEQFYNEKLLTQVLRIGISVGSKKWCSFANDGVSSEAVGKSVKDVMVGGEAENMRTRAKYYKEMAKRAVEEGGSSYRGLSDLIEELSVYQHPNHEDEKKYSMI